MGRGLALIPLCLGSKHSSQLSHSLDILHLNVPEPLFNVGGVCFFSSVAYSTLFLSLHHFILSYNELPLPEYKNVMTGTGVGWWGGGLVGKNDCCTSTGTQVQVPKLFKSAEPVLCAAGS